MKPNNDSPPTPERTELARQVESLRRDIRQLQLEHDILKKANELLKEGLGVDLPLLSNQEKTRLVDALRNAYALPELFAELGFARSSYFYHRARLRLADKYADARLAITHVFERNSPLLRLSTATGGIGQAQFLPLGESRAAFDEAGMPGRCRDEAASVRLLPGRNQPGPGQSHQP